MVRARREQSGDRAGKGMKLAAEAPLWLALILSVLLLAAAVQDAARLRISNITCALILVAGMVAIVVMGPERGVWQNFAVFGGLLAAGVPLFATGKFGGGDVKLLAVTGLWFDLQGGLLMLVTVLLAGGVLALLILALRAFFDWGESARTRVPMFGAGAGLPYGIAIAAGSLLTMAMLRA